ncbi:hypothetical protein ACFQX6_45680 [Streptosporangium lutulentum]
MNPMDQLRAARPAHLDTPVDESTRAAELSHAMAQARPARRRKISRPVWGLSLAGAAAAVTAAVAVTVTGGTAPTQGTAASGTTPSPSAPSATRSGQPVVRLSAKQILLVAAESSLKAREDDSGAYWYVEGVSGNASRVGTAVRYTVHSTGSHRLWVARSPKGESWFVDQNLGTKPAPGEEEAWKKDGSPRSGRWRCRPPSRTTSRGPNAW